MNHLVKLLLLAGLAALTVIDARAADVDAHVFSVTGTCEFAAPGSSSYAPLKAKQALAVGSTVRTGDDGVAVIVTTKGSAVQIGNSSIVKINKLAFAKSGDTVTQRTADLTLTSGVVSALIDPSTPKVTDFKIHTPEGAAAARGTFYAVMVSHGKTYVSVERGKVGAMAVPANHHL